MARRADKLTLSKRVQEVTSLILNGAEFPEVAKIAADKQWGVSERQIRNYIATAYEALADILERDRKEILGRHLAQRRLLYARCSTGENQNLTLALSILKDEAELYGLYPPQKIAPTTPDGEKPYYDGQLAEVLPELRAAVERLRQSAVAEDKSADSDESTDALDG